jgi:hypothetical protein
MPSNGSARKKVLHLDGPTTPAAANDAERPLEARLDGKRTVVEAQEEIVLRCGESSITLLRNGRVVIRGLEIETRARGTNRISGGAVKIN